MYTRMFRFKILMIMIQVSQINLCNANSHFGSFFYGTNGKIAEASNEHGLMADENFHECGMSKVCKYVVQNANYGHHATVNEGKSLQKSKKDGTIWEKEFKGMFHFALSFI